MKTHQPIIIGGRIQPGQSITLEGGRIETLNDWSPRLGGALTVLDGVGDCFRARLLSRDKARAELLVYERMPASAESALEIILLQALPGRERMEMIIEKTVELGVDLIVPWKAEKGIDLAERETWQPKAHRWAERALRAARQCRRARVPAVMPFTDLAGAIEIAQDCRLKLALDLAGNLPMQSALPEGKQESAALVIGPEGGLSQPEIAMLKQDGFRIVNLGARVLRAETAAIVAVALLQWEMGDLGGTPIDER